MTHDIRHWMRLVEGRDAPLFHGSPLCNLIRIVMDDRMQLNRRGFISLSRYYHVAKYFQEWSDSPGYGGILVLDQTKLSQRYKIQPVHDTANIDDAAFHDEAEERVFQPIAPLSNYLLSININRAAIKRALTDQEYRDESEDYAEVFAGKRKLFLTGVRMLLKHPAVNRWSPRAKHLNASGLATVQDYVKAHPEKDERLIASGPRQYEVTFVPPDHNMRKMPDPATSHIETITANSPLEARHTAEHFAAKHGYHQVVFIKDLAT
jgi:hypothetical protein